MIDYTPRQIAAFLFIARRRRNVELAEMLSLQALAARGDARAIEQKLKDLRR